MTLLHWCRRRDDAAGEEALAKAVGGREEEEQEELVVEHFWVGVSVRTQLIVERRRRRLFELVRGGARGGVPAKPPALASFRKVREDEIAASEPAVLCVATYCV